MTSALGPAALDYVGRIGWKVFPLGVRSKLPMIPKSRGGRGFHDATDNAEQIEAWWRRWPAANIGVRTGPESGFFVLDVDSRHDGESSLAKLVTKHDLLPETLTARTGSGGSHYLFAWPGQELRNTASGLGDGLDTRCAGGYIVAAPSITSGPYEWVDTDLPIAPAPGWLLRLLRKPEPSPTVLVPRTIALGFAAQILEDRTREVATSRSPAGGQSGRRNATLNACAYSLGRLIGSGVLDETEVRQRLAVAARTAGLAEREIAATIESGLGAGKSNPWKKRA